MATELCDIQGGADYETTLGRAAEVLRNGGLVVFPTETVYGLAANAVHPEAMDRLRRVKDRPDGHPFTVHLARPDAASRYVTDVEPYARRMMAKGWPGPLTLVFPVSDPGRTEAARSAPGQDVRSLYHRGTIGLRCPDHVFARDLLGQMDSPVVAASANLTGQPPPVEPAGISQGVRDKVDLVVEEGHCRYAKPSTVVRVGEKTFQILREGVLDERMLKSHAALNILLVCTGNTCRSPMAEAVCRDMLSKRLGIPADMLAEAGYQVGSAGLYGVEGAPASEGAMQAMQDSGLDLSGHVARTVDVGMLQRADHVWVMCRHHMEGITAMVPSVRDRARLLAGDEEIEDPIGQSQQRYNECAEKVAQSLQDRLEEIEL